ncbi:PIG-L family deacetylase, partial [Nocardia gipuzkoensis]
MARRTMLVILAHPDDESTTTGGTLALYAARGVRTVLVTCTNGEYGDRPYGVKPGPGHDTRAVSETRLAELGVACKHLSITDLELLGYHDSGTTVPTERDGPVLFRDIPAESVAERIGELFRKYSPDIVLTHEPDSTRHPDHRHAAQATTLAVTNT